MGKAVILISGGLDSVVLLHHVVKELEWEFEALSFVYNQRHIRELRCASFHCEELGVPLKAVDFSAFASCLDSALTQGTEMPTAEESEGDSQPTTYVPFRNLLFLAAAFGYAESSGASLVFCGVQQRDAVGYWDCTEEFVQKVQAVADLNRLHKIRVSSPFVDFAKADVVKLGCKLEVDFSRTWSCLAGGEAPCGACLSCVERMVAFDQAGVVDPLLRV